jgi:hypothetical protein
MKKKKTKRRGEQSREKGKEDLWAAVTVTAIDSKGLDVDLNCCTNEWHSDSNGVVECSIAKLDDIPFLGFRIKSSDRFSTSPESDRSQTLADISGLLVRAFPGMGSCGQYGVDSPTSRIPSVSAYNTLFQAARGGGCYSVGHSEPIANLMAWNTMCALAGFSFPLKPPPLQALARWEKRVEKTAEELTVPYPVPCANLGAVLPLSLICRVALHSRPDILGPELVDLDLFRLAPFFAYFHACAAADWFSYHSPWHSHLYDGTCWRLGVACLRPGGSVIAAVAAVDTD